MSSELRIDVDDSDFDWGETSGAHCSLIYDPEDHRVYSWYVIGGGTPESVWNGRALRISVPLKRAGVAEWCRLNQERFDSLRESYKGSEWDGSNHSGRWDDLVDDRVYELADAIANETQTLCSARDIVELQVQADAVESALKCTPAELAYDYNTNGYCTSEEACAEAIEQLREYLKEKSDEAA